MGKNSRGKVEFKALSLMPTLINIIGLEIRLFIQLYHSSIFRF
jgi:hypothetical protein